MHSITPIKKKSPNSEKENKEQPKLYLAKVLQAKPIKEVNMDVLTLLNLFGIPFVFSPYEAEAQCAQLEMYNLIDGVITEDSDTFLFGGRNIFKNFFGKNNPPELYRQELITQNLGLEREDLINLALLLGSDYDPGVRNIGPVIALKILAEFNDLFEFKKWYEKRQEKYLENNEENKKKMKTKKNKNLIIQKQGKIPQSKLDWIIYSKH